jgi:hypothetical protein
MGRMQEKFPISFRALYRALNHVRLETKCPDGMLDLAAGRSVQLGVANNSALAHVFPSHFKLRFYKDNHFTFGWLQHGGDCRQQQGHRYETNIAHGEAAGFSDISQCECPRICVVPDHDSRVSLDLPVELSRTHIHRVHPRRSVLQQTVNEAACRRTDIDAAPACRVDVPVPESPFQLQPAAAHIPELLKEPNVGILGNAVTRLIRLLSVNQNVPGENESLRFRTRLDETTIDQKLIDSLPPWFLHALR